MAKKFDLAALMGAEASNLDNAMQIEEVALDHIRGNEDNFFEVSDVDDLADSIALVGLQQPLVVMREGLKKDGKVGYILIAGHRRLKALQQLGRETAPCIVTSPANDELEALALIQTNTMARSLDYAARMEAVKRTEAALLALKEKGYALPGKMRDRVAEITQEKASEIARMKVIDKNLSAPLRQALADGKINASVAYALARLDDAGQEHFAEKIAENDYVTAYMVEDYRTVQEAASWMKTQCPCKSFQTACPRYCVVIIAKCRDAGKEVTCCFECPDRPTCKNVCYDAKTYRTPEQRAAEKEKLAREQAELDKKWAETPGSCLPKRLHIALRLRDMSQEHLNSEIEKLVGEDCCEAPDEDENDVYEMPDACTVAAVCKILGVSADWLLGLKEQPKRAGWFRPDTPPPEGAEIIVMDHTGYVDDAVFDGERLKERDFSSVRWEDVVWWAFSPMTEENNA